METVLTRFPPSFFFFFNHNNELIAWWEAFPLAWENGCLESPFCPDKNQCSSAPDSLKHRAKSEWKRNKSVALRAQTRTHCLDYMGFSDNGFTNIYFTWHRIILSRCINHWWLAYFQSCAIVTTGWIWHILIAPHGTPVPYSSHPTSFLILVPCCSPLLSPEIWLLRAVWITGIRSHVSQGFHQENWKPIPTPWDRPCVDAFAELHKRQVGRAKV